MNYTRQAMDTVLDRMVVAKRLGGLHLAEAAGMLRALCAEMPSAQMYRLPERHARYLMGFREAKSILRVESQLTAEPGRTA